MYTAALEMHPLDVEDRLGQLKDEGGSLQHHQVLHEGVPGEHHDHDNAIIPLKERGGRVL